MSTPHHQRNSPTNYVFFWKYIDVKVTNFGNQPFFFRFHVPFFLWCVNPTRSNPTPNKFKKNPSHMSYFPLSRVDMYSGFHGSVLFCFFPNKKLLVANHPHQHPESRLTASLTWLSDGLLKGFKPYPIGFPWLPGIFYLHEW